MTNGIAFLVGALIAAALGHRFLQFMTRTTLGPRIIITSWLISAASALLTFTAGVVLMAVPDHGGLGGLLHRIGGCWNAVQHGALPRSEEFAASLTGAALAALVARFGVIAIRHTRLQRRRRDKYRFLSTLAATPGASSGDVLWLDHAHPLAFSIGGRPGLIAASNGLRDHLGPAALAATLEHERAHLRGRHHLLIDLVDISAGALPFIPLFQAAPAMMRELVEMAADRAAVCRFGAAPVIEALRALAAVPAPREGLAMTGAAVSRRLHRLESPGAPENYWRSVGVTSLVAIVCTVTPSVLGVGLLFSIACSVG